MPLLNLIVFLPIIPCRVYVVEGVNVTFFLPGPKFALNDLFMKSFTWLSSVVDNWSI